MSLTCKTSIFCETEKDHYYVKVVYNRLDSSDIELAEISKPINDIHNQIAESIDVPGRHSALIEQLEENYIHPPHIKQIKYIFLGEYSDEIKDELDKIAVNIKDNTENVYLDVNIESLSTAFGYVSNDLLVQDWDLVSEKYESVVFVPFYISKHDTIKFMYHILGHYCNDNPHQDVFRSQALYIYGAAINVDPQISQIQSRIIEDSKIKYLKYTTDQLRLVLGSYLVPSVIIDKLMLKYDSDNIHQSLLDIINHPVILHYFKLYAKYQNIRYVYQRVGKMTYPIDSNIVTYLDNGHPQYKQSITSSTIRLVNLYENMTLNGQYAAQNTFYMYNYHNIGKELISLQLLSEETKEDVYKHFISKLFPNIEIDNVITDLQQPYDAYLDTDSYRTDRTILTKYSRITQSYSQYIPSPALLDIQLDKSYLLILRHKLVFPKDIDIRSIFNDIPLSFDIPFVKFKDTGGSREIIYKIFKPITEKKTFKYKPIVSREELDEWIRYKSYEFEIDTLRHIKNNPKEISYKILLSKVQLPEKLDGVIFQINEDKTYDIEYKGTIIREIPRDYIIAAGSLNITDNIIFHNYKTIYLDIDIFKKGYMTVTIDTRLLNEDDFSDNLLNIIGQMNRFHNTLFSIESLQSYTILNNTVIDLQDIEIYNRGHITNMDNMIYSYKLKVPRVGATLKVVNREFLERTAHQLYPFVRVQEQLYRINDPILYYDEDKQIYVKGFIKSYSLDNTYEIDLIDPEQGVSQPVRLSNIPKLFIKPTEEPKIHKMFELSYIRVSDYDDTSPIQALLQKFEEIGLETSIKLNRIMELLTISREDALDILHKGNLLSKSSYSNMGIKIRIDYVPQLFSESEDNIYIYVENIKSNHQIKEIYHFIHYFFELYFSISEQIRPIRPYFNQFFGDDIATGEIELKKIADATIQSAVSIEQDQLQDIEDEFSDDDMDEWSDDEDDDVADDTGVIQNVIDDALSDAQDDTVIIEGDIDQTADESKTEHALDDVMNPEYIAHLKLLTREIKQDTALSKSTKNIGLDKLYELDPILFQWSISNKEWKPTYAASCQGSRQPKIITDAEKKRIDDAYEVQKRSNPKVSKVSYHTSPGDMDCEKATFQVSKNKKIKCGALKWGSSSDEESHYWYICPKIIELNSNTPLNIEDLEWGVDAIFTPTEVKDPSAITGSEWRTDKTTGEDILTFKPSYKGKHPVPNDNILKTTRNHSLLFLQKKENRTYPGFMNRGSHPLNLYFPCCFKDYSAKVDVAFGTPAAVIHSTQQSGYVQNWGKHLSHNPIRYGLLPTSLLKFFNPYQVQIDTEGPPNYTYCTTGQLSDLTGCFLRQGIDQGPDNFLSLIADLASHEGSKVSLAKIKQHILTTLDYDTFRLLNNGNLFIQFQYLGKQSSFQNYLEYTISNQPKEMKFFYELLTKPSPFFTNGLRLIIIDYNDENDTFQMLCPSFCNITLQPNADTAIVLKHNNKYEPICQILRPGVPGYKLYNNAWKDAQTMEVNADGEIVDKTPPLHHEELMDFIDINLKEAFDNGCLQSSMIPSKLIDVSKIYNRFIIDKKYSIAEVIEAILGVYLKVRYLIRDSYNKIIGIYLNNSVVVPVYPQIYNKEEPLSYLIKDIPDIELTDLDNVLTTYRKLENYSKKTIYITPIKYIEEDDMIIGFISNIGVYIQITPLPSSEVGTGSHTQANYFEIDKKLKEYQEKYEKSIYKTPLSFAQTIEHIRKLQIRYPNENYELQYIIISEDDESVTAIQFRCGIYVEVIAEPITEKIRSTYKTNKSLETDDLDNYLTYGIELSRLSDYKIYSLPVRGNMDNNKQYTGIILETGLDIKLHKKFYIYDKIPNRPGMYFIEKIIEEPLIDQIFGSAIIDKPLFIDERIKTNQKLKYISDIYDLITKELVTFLQIDTLYSIKEYLLGILLHDGLSSSQKKILIKPIIELIFSVVIQEMKDTDITNIPIIQPDTSCNTAQCELPYCNRTKLNVVELDSINQLVWKGYSEFNSDGSEDIDGRIIADIISKFQPGLLDNALQNYNSLVLKLNSEIKTYCQTQIIDDTEKNRILKIKNRIFHEMVYNKYKRNQLFYYFKKKISGERYKVNAPFEILLTSTDYNISKLNTLYNLIRQKYYNQMLPFDQIQLDLSVNIDMVRQSISTCSVKTPENYTLPESIWGSKQNRNTDNTASLIVPLRIEQYQKLFYDVMSLNVELVNCPVLPPEQYVIEQLDEQKQLQ
jgi:hypothetical protein